MVDAYWEELSPEQQNEILSMAQEEAAENYEPEEPDLDY
jgi:TRAP-type C4-dicarboxylate transport system substrate-binding protein